jgi:hypothetical protein
MMINLPFKYLTAFGERLIYVRAGAQELPWKERDSDDAADHDGDAIRDRVPSIGR